MSNPRRCGEHRCCLCGKKKDEPPRYPVQLDPDACKGDQVPTYTHTVCEACYPAYRTEQERLLLASESHEELTKTVL